MARTSKASIVRRFAQGFGLVLTVSQEKRAVSFVTYDDNDQPVIDQASLASYLESLGGVNPNPEAEATEEEALPLVAYYNMPVFGEPNTKITLQSTKTGELITSRRKVHKSTAGNFVVYMATCAPGERHRLEDLELDSKPQLFAQIVRRIRSWFGPQAISVTKDGVQVNLRVPE